MLREAACVTRMKCEAGWSADEGGRRTPRKLWRLYPRPMETQGGIWFLLAWFALMIVLQRWILPRAGIGT